MSRIGSRYLLAASAILFTFSAGCTADTGEDDPVDSESDALTRAQQHAAEREKWTRHVKTELRPRLQAAGLSDDAIKRIVFWGIAEGIYTVESNVEYGQRGGRQSPLSFSNCGDDLHINRGAALPPCGKMWQVGIAGIIVDDARGRLPEVFRKLYGTTRPAVIGRRIMPQLGESPDGFPDVDIADVAASRRLASVLLRDPVIAFVLQQSNSWLRGSRPRLSLPRGYAGLPDWFLRDAWTLIDRVWAEP